MSNEIKHNDADVIGFLHDFYAARFFILTGVLFAGIVAFLLLYVAVPQKQANMLIGPAELMDTHISERFNHGQSSYLRLSNSENGQAQSVSNFVRFQAVMQGASVAKLLLRDPRIVEGIVQDQKFVFEEKREADIQASELAQYITKRVRFDPFGETSLKAISYQHRDAGFAAYFLQRIHRVSDQLIRADLRSQVDQRIAYLERLIGKTSNPEQRRILTNLLLEQERGRMMVSMETPVAASVIEPVSAGIKTVWPNPYLFYGGFGFVGLLLGYLAFGLVQYGQRFENEKIKQSSYDDFASERLKHQPKRPLKYGSWFKDEPDNVNEPLDQSTKSVRRDGV